MKKEFLLVCALASSVTFAQTESTTVTTVTSPAPVPVQVRPTVKPQQPGTTNIIINNNIPNKPTLSDRDAGITSSIYDHYGKDSALIGTALTVTSDNGVVTVTGTVTQQSQSDEAISVAKSMPGVQSVVNKINVLTNQPTNTQPSPVNY